VAAQPRRKDPAPPSPPRTWARAPTWSSGTPAANRPGNEADGRYHVYPRPGRDLSIWQPSPGCCTQESGRLCDGGQHAVPVLVCEAIDMAARRCPTRREKTIFHPRPRQPVHFRAAREAPERLRHSSFGGQDRGALGGCLGGVLQRDPQGTKKPTPMVHHHETQGHQRYCLPGRAWYTSQTRLHSALGYRTPNETEHDFASSNKAA